MMLDCSSLLPLRLRSPSSTARCRSRPASLLLIRRMAATSLFLHERIACEVQGARAHGIAGEVG